MELPSPRPHCLPLISFSFPETRRFTPGSGMAAFQAAFCTTPKGSHSSARGNAPGKQGSESHAPGRREGQPRVPTLRGPGSRGLVYGGGAVPALTDAPFRNGSFRPARPVLAGFATAAYRHTPHRKPLCGLDQNENPALINPQAAD